MRKIWQSEAEVAAIDSRQIDLFNPAAIEHVASFANEDSAQAQPSQNPSPRAARPTPASEIVIEDAGAELTYNRRNRSKSAKTWADIEGLNDALKVKEATKANIWPKPDYAQLIADGMQPLVAHIVKQVYDSLPAKPVVRAGVAVDGVLQTYINALNRVETGVKEWTNDKEALQAWAGKNARMAGAMLGRSIALTDMMGGAESLKEFIYPQGWKAYADEIRILGGNKFYKNLEPGYDEIKRALDSIKKGWPDKREAWQVQGMYVASNPEVESKKSASGDCYSLYVNGKYIDYFNTQEEVDTAKALIKPYVLFGKRGLIDSFDSEEDAIAFARERVKREKGATIDEAGTNVTEAVRRGPDRRMEGENITSEQLRQTFGFKGVNFGNWLKTPATKLEAQLHLNHAYDAFMDLSEILDVPPKALSLGGMLGLAIGAQGGGGTASAHFVPGVNEINITRTTGSGFLSHEFAHALDHYFATQAGLDTATEPYLTAHATLGAVRNRMVQENGRWVNKELARFGEVRPEIVEAFKTIVQTMNKREQTEEEAQAQRSSRSEQNTKQVGKWLAAIRRDFTKDDAPHPFDELAERVRKLDYGDGMIAVGRNHLLSPVVVEMRELYKKEHGRVYDLENCKSLQAWMNSHKHSLSSDREERKHVPQLVSSEYAARSFALDKDKGGKPYWSTDVEKFARAFDAFVSDALEEKNALNTYLSSASRTANTLPAGEERKAIGRAFEALIGEIKTKETERGPILFSLDDTRTSVTQSENFKEWFGDSKVKHPDGAPKVMYHGTPVYEGKLGDFDVFDRKATQKVLGRPQTFDMIGSWFSDNHDNDGAAKYAGPNGAIYPVFLSIENPLVVRSFDELFDLWKDENSGKHADKTIEKRFKQNNWYGDADNFVELLKRDGFDGIRILTHSSAGSSEFADQEAWIAFDPHQIKAAYGNNREFSKDNPSILYSVGETQALPSLTVAEIDAEVQRRKGAWRGMPDVVVVDSVSQLPFDAPATANGALQDGRMFLVAENLHNMAQLQKVLAHECVGHYALEEMLGEEKFDQLCDKVQALKAAGDPTICAIASDINARYSSGNGALPLHVESAEIIARSVERCLDGNGNIKVEFGWAKSVYADVATWLRERGFDIPFSNFELQGMLSSAGEWIKEKPLNHSDSWLSHQASPVFSVDEQQKGAASGFDSNRDAHAWAAGAMREHLSDPMKALPAQVARQEQGKRYVGAVVAANESFIAQHIGRELAIHPRSDLVRVPAVGESVTIQYNGQQRGEILERNRAISHTR